MKTILYTVGCVYLATSFQAYAQEGDSPFSAEFVVELQNDGVIDSDDPDGELNNFFATIEGALSYSFGSGSSVNATLLIEPVEDPDDDSFLEDHGLFAEELFFAQDFGAGELILGKFNPAFGVAWDAAPGIYGVDFAEDYELAEFLGAGVNVPLQFAGGEHVISVAVFQADRTFLSNSAGEERGRTRLSDGGPANTSGPESIAVALSGEFGATSYNIGVQYLSAGEGDEDDQTGFVAGVIHTLGGAAEGVELLGEVVWFDSFDGSENEAVFVTVGASVPVGPVTLSGVYSLRDVETASADHLATVSAEMELVEGLVGSIGYRYGDEEGVESHTLGALLVYEF